MKHLFTISQYLRRKSVNWNEIVNMRWLNSVWTIQESAIGYPKGNMQFIGWTDKQRIGDTIDARKLFNWNGINQVHMKEFNELLDNNKNQSLSKKQRDSVKNSINQMNRLSAIDGIRILRDNKEIDQLESLSNAFISKQSEFGIALSYLFQIDQQDAEMITNLDTLRAYLVSTRSIHGTTLIGRNMGESYDRSCLYPKIPDRPFKDNEFGKNKVAIAWTDGSNYLRTTKVYHDISDQLRKANKVRVLRNPENAIAWVLVSCC